MKSYNKEMTSTEMELVGLECQEVWDGVNALLDTKPSLVHTPKELVGLECPEVWDRVNALLDTKPSLVHTQKELVGMVTKPTPRTEPLETPS